LAALFIVIMHFAAPVMAAAPEAKGQLTYSVTVELPDNTYGSEDVTAVLGEDITAVRISDLGKPNRLTKVNYAADKFVRAGSLSPDMQIVDLTEPFEFAEKGTLAFVIMNLDPDAEDFHEQAEKLSEFKIGDYWHFTLELPKIFNASNIYDNMELIARNGDIENYDFSVHSTNYDKKTENYSQKVERTALDLKFYTRRHALNLYRVITVHYQSSGTVYSGLADCPIIGTENKVENIYDKSQDLLISIAVIAAVVCAVLVALSILKRTVEYISEIVWIFGIVLMLFPKFLLGQSIAMPLLWAALSWSGAFFTLGGALFALGRNFGRVPAKYIFPALMLVGGVLAFAYPFAPFGAAGVMRTAFTVIKAIGAAALLVFAGFKVFGRTDANVLWETVTASIIAVAVAASVFLPSVFPVYFNSMFWLCVVTVITTFIGVFKVFRDTERANAYLTANLHTETERQLKDIKSVIAERDELLRFVSHDMKKPLQSSSVLLDELIERETDAEQTKGLKIVKQHTARVISNLSEISSYARFNYIAEPSQTVDLSEMCASLYEFHKPDCDANGIILKNLVTESYKVFVKKQGLENAVSNILLNAIEHANCKTITLSANIDKNRIVLSISDDGKGISDGVDVFGAYSSEKPSSTGVGLFICKNIIESMSGELSYENSGGAVFNISLLKA